MKQFTNFFLTLLTSPYPQKASRNVFRGANRLKKSSRKVDLDSAKLLLNSSEVC